MNQISNEEPINLNQPAEKNIPAILFNTLPKSGSIYISDSLRKGLGLKRYYGGGGAFPNRVIDRVALAEIALGNYVFQDHYEATEHNLFVLRQFLPKLVLHVRDVRQSLLSWIHHLNKIRLDAMTQVILHIHKIPPVYFSKSIDYQIDFQIDVILPMMINWLAGWVHELENSEHNLSILVTTFEEFKTDSEMFYKKILSFFCIDHHLFTMPAEPVIGEKHYRKGMIDEWRVVFNEKQKRKCENLIPLKFMNLFGWE